jgi:hypothetical protein
MLSLLKTKKSAGIKVTSAVHQLIARGNEARDRGDWDDAAEIYRKAVSADPTLVHIWVQLGHAEKERRRFGDAEAAYARAAMLAPDEAEPLLHLGHIYKLLGNVPASVRAYLRAARTSAADPYAVEELQRLIAGTAPFARPDLIGLLRKEIFGEEAILAARQTGAARFLLDVSSLVSAAMAGRTFADHGLVGHRLAPTLIEQLGQPVAMCAHLTGHSRWLAVSPIQFAQILTLGQPIGTIARQAAIDDLDMSFLLSNPLEMPSDATLLDLDADQAPADHALFVAHARREHGVRYVACGTSIASELRAEATLRIEQPGGLTADALRDAIAREVAAPPARSPAQARVARVERLSGEGKAFRVGTGWLPPEDWGCWAVMPGGNLEAEVPAIDKPRLYLRLKGLPTELTHYQISLADGRTIEGEIDRGQFKWVVLDDVPIVDGILELRIRGENSRLVKIQGSARELPATIGVANLFICERDDRAARLALLEATTLGDLESLS